MNAEKKKNKYTCNDYRDEIILAGLQRRMQQSNLGKEERRLGM